MLAAMVGGTAVVMLLGARDAEPPRPAPPPPKPAEAPWLTSEAAAQLIAPGGTMGPLFAGVTLGGAEPPSPIRERIAAFAKDNHVAIGLEMEGGNVKAVTVGVTFRGGFGYEGADVLALRMERPSSSSGECCVCGPDSWYDDWGIGLSDGTYLHARVRVNHVEARWVVTMSQGEIVTLAESLLDASMSDVRRRVGDRLLERDGLAYVEVPFASTRADNSRVRPYGDFAITLSVEVGRVADVRVDLRAFDDQEREENARLVTQRWGRPRQHHNEHSTWWTWRRPDRIITATTYDDIPSDVSFRTFAYQRELDASP